MSSLKDLINGNPFHSRSIEMKSYVLDDDCILVEGWLREDRFQPVYALTGEKIEPGPVHHMAIRLKLGGAPPTILMPKRKWCMCPLNSAAAPWKR